MATYKFIKCPKCGNDIKIYANPIPTVDIIIEFGQTREIVLIERGRQPFGYAIPGGFVDYGESVEDAAKREALEETGLNIQLKYILGVYSDPKRDKRFHTISTVFVAEGHGIPLAGDDAAKILIVSIDEIPTPLCFDHEKILNDYLKAREQKSHLFSSTKK